MKAGTAWNKYRMEMVVWFSSFGKQLHEELTIAVIIATLANTLEGGAVGNGNTARCDGRRYGFESLPVTADPYSVVGKGKACVAYQSTRGLPGNDCRAADGDTRPDAVQ